MYKRPYALLLVIISCVLIIGCAKKGSITGGEKDETPPKFLKASPPNFSTKYTKDEIRIYFDEYIRLKDAQKQIIVSPPMDPKPTITPMGGASKFVKVQFLDTLLENTTYSINFGQSIEDNNEGNPISYFKYVFSTGDHLDSLSIKGTVNDALAKNPDPFITVALYEVDEKYTDSLIFKQVPRYVSNTLQTKDFEIENVKEGTYKLIVLKDASTNYTYEPKLDKIGFYEDVITLPADTAKAFSVNLFKEILSFKALKPKQASKNKFIFGYEGDADSMDIKILSDIPNDFKSRIIKDKEKDSIYYWYKPFFKADSLIFEITNTKNVRDTVVARYRDQYKDSLVLTSNVKGSLPFNEKFTISSNTPLENINEKLISLVDKDTVAIPFKAALDLTNNQVVFTFERSESNAYKVQLLPETIKDFIGNVNDTLNFNFRTKKIADYGIIFFTVQKAKEYPVIVQLIDDKEKLIREKIINKEETITFEYLNPGKYYARVIYDSNKNNKWDTGDFLKGIQPEEVYYYPDQIDVRANWELKQTFVLE